MNRYSQYLQLCDSSRVLAWILILNVGLSLIVMCAMSICFFTGGTYGWIEDLLALPGNVSILLMRPWTIVTYMVTQFNPLALLFNVLWLFWFGKILLLSLRERHLLWLYVVGALFGGACYVVVESLTGGYGRLVGSSPAMLAVMTAAAVLMPDRHVNFLLVGAVRLKWVAGAAVLLTFLGVGGGGGGAQSAHIGGAVFGLVYAIVMRLTHRREIASRTLFSGYDNYSSSYGASGDSAPPSRSGAWRSSSSPRQRRAEPIARALREQLDDRRSDREKLDALLDKIGDSGYASLSPEERAQLKELSQKL